MDPEQTAYDELYAYTMGRPRFILQHVVDAHRAQSATADTKPMPLWAPSGFSGGRRGNRTMVPLGVEGISREPGHDRRVPAVL